MKRHAIAAILLLTAPCTGQQVWNGMIKLRASDGTTGDLFGYRVGLDGDRAVVGAWFDDDLGESSGSVYLFEVSSAQERIKLAASDGEAYDFFGCAVAIEGGTAVVGSRGDDGSTGAAYVYDVETGVERHKLTAPDGAGGDQFGVAVAISGNRIVVGARNDDDLGPNSGSAYVFHAQTGAFLSKLVPTGGDSSDLFGESVAIEGARAVVGAPHNDGQGSDAGAAYVFDVATGQQLFELTAADAAPDDFFATSLAFDDGRIVAGAPGDDDAGSASGSAYVFDAASGAQLLKWTASDGQGDDEFGASVDASGRRALVGAPGDDEGASDTGSAYVFDLRTGQERARLGAYDQAAVDHFGGDVAINGVEALVGADLDDDFGNAAGSAYPFELDAVGTSFCGPAVPNSTGLSATIQVYGSPLIAEDELTLSARGLPPGEFGYFLVGRTPGLFQPPGSSGFICLNGNIGRYNPVAAIVDGPGGFLEVDLAAIPVNPPVPAMTGDTWHFQCWFRDAGTSHFTDAAIVSLF
ncbi:MAG: hypothetical protein GY711_07775 [bacterium]|nr:hypothetical protein [bacterium]